MIEPPAPPKRKNPLKKTRLPLSPQGERSRTAHGLTMAAAEGRFALQRCSDCGMVVYPPRDACPTCLSPRLPYREGDARGVLVAGTTVRVSTDPSFCERLPWRVGTVKLAFGPGLGAPVTSDVGGG